MRTSVYDIGKIRVPEDHRPLDENTVVSLMQSIGEFGLIHPIVVEFSSEETGVLLVAGRHRLEACRRLDHALIEGVNIYSMIVEDDPEEARLVRPVIEIQENLYRLDTTARKRAEKRLLAAQEALSRYRAKRAASAEPEHTKTKQADPTVSEVSGQRVPKLCSPTVRKPARQKRQDAGPGTKGGRPRNAAKDEVAKMVGVTRRSLNRDMRSAPPPPPQPHPTPREPEPQDMPQERQDRAGLDRIAEEELQRELYERCLSLWETFAARSEFREAYLGMNSQRRGTFWKFGSGGAQ